LELLPKKGKLGGSPISNGGDFRFFQEFCQGEKIKWAVTLRLILVMW
jgi:hypothetical protein